WVFPRADYPFYREPLEVYCARPGVALDADAARCNNVNQQATSRSEKPWNIVLILLETQRAMNIGHLKPYGALHSSSPYLDSMAARGAFWTRMVATGLPTINSWMSLHLSVPQHPTRFLA